MYIPTPARLVRACTVGLLSLGSLTSAVLAGPPIKNPKEVVVEAHPMYLGTVTGGVKTSDAYTEGNFSIVAPVWSTLGADATLSGDVIYLEPYTSWGERGEVAASLGLGWRHLFGSQSVSALRNYDAPQAGFFDEGIFVGANVFIDMMDTEADNQFWQLGVGLEVGTRYVEVRGNYYIPLSDKQLAEETRTVDTIQRSSTSTSQSVTPTSDPYASGSSVAQNALFTTTATTTISTTTIERLFRRYEEGMEGWDAEIAFLVPGLDRYFDLRFIGGYYKFDNQPFGPQEGGTGNVEGWKAGVEIRPVPAVILTGTWYEDERLTGSDWTAGVQLQVPFEMGDLGDGKNFWSRIGDSFTPRRRHLVERLAEPVRRQNAAIKVANTVDTETNTETKVKRVTKVVSQRPGQVVLEDDIIFVNNGGAVGNGIQAGTAQVDGATGTAERPFDTIVEGANLAGANSNATGKLWTVYTQGGTGIDYEDSVMVSGSTRFTSSYVPIVGLGGRNFGGDTDRPVLYGGFGAFEINTLIVQGYDFRGGIMGGFGPSVIALNPGTLIVQDNLFTMGELPPFGEFPEFPEIEELLPLFLSSVSVLADSDGGTHNIIVQNNEFNEVFGALFVGAGLDLGIFGPPALSALDCGCGGGSSPIVNILATNNIINNAYMAGMYITAGGGSTVNANLSNNFFLGEFGFDGPEFGMATLVETYDGAIANVQLTGNIYEGYFNQVVSGFYSEYESILNATVTGNTILADSEYGVGFGFVAFEGATMTATIANNAISGESYDGMLTLDSFEGATLIASISGNTFEGDGCGEIAIAAKSRDGSTLRADILGNTFVGDFDHALDADKRDWSRMTLTFSNNVLNGEFGRDALKVAAHHYDDEDGDRLKVTITNNQFFGDYDASGIFLLAEHDAVLKGTVTGNVFHGGFEDNAIQLKSQHGGRLAATVADNILSADGVVNDAFLKARSNDGSRLRIKGFDRNLVLGSGTNPDSVGFFFREDGGSKLTVDGTFDPAASNFVSEFFLSPMDVVGNPSGDFFLNGAPVSP
ncbi:inverse autotransporter-like protein with beta domain [Roseimicrobium gellanilyticum]|uniref:Inverse autotransporter-like protein with beta domain n=1 Tax=Roseimicrobium gellanilyticum TaxID=748857 RepID=A0A366HS40_9BACT|nr:inverse autotransporter beta domain-containing protein [Roseimicrobium gellanilyticum]RBP46492.1 inverse autotransporter-like protein with beta domain [Roseimicrobium gellanilyticum]